MSVDSAKRSLSCTPIFRVPAPNSTALVDFHVCLQRTGPLPSLSRSCRFHLAGGFKMDSVVRSAALASLEWGMNACIYRLGQLDLMVHAAVLERDGQAVLLVGASGSGKSTLCSALALSGWRLLSDELGLVSFDDGRLTGTARPIILKNRAIDIVRETYPDAVFGPLIRNTPKGTVSHVRPPRESVLKMDERAVPQMALFVEFRAARTEWNPVSKGQAMIRLADSSFNFGVLGRSGFNILGEMVERCHCGELIYGDLHDALELIQLQFEQSRVSAATTVGA